MNGTSDRASVRSLRCSHLLTIVLCCLSAVAAADPAAWEVPDGPRHVIVEGDRAFALKSAMRLRAIEATGRWILGWPDDFHPPTALVFELKAATVRQLMSQNPGAGAENVDPYTPIGVAAALPGLSLIIAPLGSERGVEFAPLQSLYGSLLPGIDQRLAGWPVCVQRGVEELLIAASYENSDRLLIDGRRIAAGEVLNPEMSLGPKLVREYRVLAPANFLDPAAATPVGQADKNERGLACFILTHWYVTADPDRRRAFEQLFTSLGAGRPLSDSVPITLGDSPAAFTTNYQRYASHWRNQPRSFDIRRVVLLPSGPLPDPVPIAAERLAALLRQTCLKLSRCRVP